ncbi:MAG: hypothetical protein WBN04_00780 [Paracoccaceae bacterium]
MSKSVEEMLPVEVGAATRDLGYVDWGAILAGSVIAAAIAFVFTSFGAALGLSIISPYGGEGSAIAAIVAVASWMLWTTVSSFMAGGYVAGRMRRRVGAVSSDEVNIRDGIHGLSVWAVGVLLGALLLSATADTAARTIADMAAATDQITATGTDSTTDTAATPAPNATTAADVKAAAETARKYSVLSAFALAAALLIAAAGAYWAASVGGRHRDENVVLRRFGTWT